MRPCRWRRTVFLPLLAGMALFSAACDKDETEDGVGEELAFSAAPSTLHLAVANPAVSTLSFTLTDLKDAPLAGETIELELATGGPPGMLSAASVVTDAMGQATATFSSALETTALVTATHNLLIGLRAIQVFDEDLGSVTLPSTATFTSCTSTVTLLGLALDTQSPAVSMTGVSVKAEVISTDIDGTATLLLGGFTPDTVTTDNSGIYSLTFDPDDTECGTLCAGAAICHWIVRFTATAPGSGKVVVSATNTTISDGV